MLPTLAEKSPKILKRILEQKFKLVIWGARFDFTFSEWQRQIKAEFIVDTKEKWWNKKVFHNLPVYSPNEIGKLNTTESLIINNYYDSRSVGDVSEWLKRLGNYRSTPPLLLHEMAHRADGYKNKKKLSLKTKKNLDHIVNTSLESLLTPPCRLNKAKSQKEIDELVHFLKSYKIDDYLYRALPNLHEENMSSLNARAGHVCLTIGSLSRGGAERQLCNLAVGLRRAGWTPTVLIYDLRTEGAEHFTRFLRENDVDVKTFCYTANDDPTANTLKDLKDLSHPLQMALWHLPTEFALRTLQIYHALRKLRAELLISYLDTQNIFASLGGLLAGVPRMNLSGRNLNPTHLPQFYKPSAIKDFRKIYRLALAQPYISMSNNSSGGAGSYASWLGIPAKKISVVSNCVTEEFTQTYHSNLIKAKRKELGLEINQPFILGVFRLTKEKRPADFIKIISTLRKLYPHLRAAICGPIPEGSQIADLIKKLKLNSTLKLLGNIDDVSILMNSATLLLHTAEIEGSPNVIIEAQASGLPIVCAKNAGTQACLDKGWHPFMKEVGDIKGLAASCDKIIKDPKRMKQLAKAARKATLKRCSLKKLTEDTLAVSRVRLKRPIP